jgi:hypothetical protein
MTSQLHKKGEAWSARFSEPMSELVKRYTSSVFFDKRPSTSPARSRTRASSRRRRSSAPTISPRSNAG